MSRRMAAGLALAGAACLAVSGCASVATLPAEPFQQYHGSVVQLAASADQALATEQALTYQRYVEAVKATGAINELQLEPDPEGSVFDMNVEEVPLIQEIRAARANLAALHSLVEQYARFLLALAGEGDSSYDVDAVALASELRAEATQLATSLNASAELDEDWFFGFGLLAQEYVESRRRDVLLDLLQSAADEMRALAELGQQISMLSAAGIQAEYLASYSRDTLGANDLDEDDLDDLVDDVLGLNTQTLRQLELLKQLHDAYGALPGTHLQLQSAVASGAAPSVSVLLTYAESLRDKYRSFSEE